MYKLDLTGSMVWTNFVMFHAIDDLIVGMKNLQKSEKEFGIIGVHHDLGPNVDMFVVDFDCQESAVKFLLAWG